MSKIKIILNGQEKFFDQQVSISELVEDLELDAKKIAVELNYQILLPENFQEIFLQNDDRVEIVHFIGGG